MAVVENRSSEIGDVMRIKTNIPIVGLVSLTSFIDSTVGENVGVNPSDTIPPFNARARLSNRYFFPVQNGNILYAAIYSTDGTDRIAGLASVNLDTKVWDLSYPESMDETTSGLVYDGGFLYSFHFEKSGESSKLTIRKTNVATKIRTEVATTQNSIFSDFGIAIKGIFDNKLYYSSSYKEGDEAVRINYCDLTAEIFGQETVFPVKPMPNNKVRVQAGVINPTGRIYLTYSHTGGVNENALYPYNLNNQNWENPIIHSEKFIKEVLNWLPDSNKVVSVLLSDPKKPITYEPGTNIWATLNAAPLANLFAFVENSGKIYASSSEVGKYTFIYTISNGSWGSPPTDIRLFSKFFRYSIDAGTNFSEFMPLNDINLQLIDISKKDQFVVEVTYTRVGTDASGTIAFNDFTLSGNYLGLDYPIYDTTVFKDFFGINDPDVLTWALNVLEKLHEKGIIPDYLNRGIDSNNAAFTVLFGSITHLFAILVQFSRLFQNILQEPGLMELFIRTFGLAVSLDADINELTLLLTQRLDEFKKRGTEQIKHISSNGADISGELTRLINHKRSDEYLFELAEPQKFGWCLGESSPTWTNAYGITNLNKSYEQRVYPKDLTKYPLIEKNNGSVDIVEDPVLGENVIRLTPQHGIAGIGFNPYTQPDSAFFINVNPNIDYEIRFKIKKEAFGLDRIRFGLLQYDELGRYLQNIPVGGDSFEPRLFTNRANITSLLKDDIYYQFSGIVFKAGTTYNNQLSVIRDGRHLAMRPSTKFIVPYIYAEGNNTLYIYNLEITPRELPVSQGQIGVKNIIVGYLQNRSGIINSELTEMINAELTPFDSTLLLKYL